MKQKWAIFLFVGISLALIRIFVSGHFNVTGIKLIPEFIMIIRMIKVSDVFQEINYDKTVKILDSMLEVRKKTAEITKSHRAIYVVDGDNNLLGIITIQNILKSIAVQNGITITKTISKRNLLLYLSKDSIAKDLMISAIYVKLTDSIDEVVAKMVNSNLEELPVVNSQMKLIGIVDANDIIKAFE